MALPTPAGPRRTRRQVLGLVAASAAAATAGCGAIDLGGRGDRLVETYQSGFEAYRAGATAYNDGAIAYQDDEYDRAIERLNAAKPHLATARSKFETATSIAADIGNQPAEDICSTAAETAALLVEAVDLLRQAATALQRDAVERAQARYDSYKQTAREASQRTVRKPKALASTVDDELLEF